MPIGSLESGAPKVRQAGIPAGRTFLVSVYCSGRKPLGGQEKSSRVRIARRLSIAAVPVAGLATAFCISSSGSHHVADASTHRVSTPVKTSAAAAVAAVAGHKAVAGKTAIAGKTSAAGHKATPGAAKLLATTKPPVRHAVKPASTTVWYTVKAGDSLSSIAQHYYNDASAWPVLYWANGKSVTIQPGQRLRIPAKPAHIPAAPVLQVASSTSSSDSAGTSSGSAVSSDASSGSSSAASSSTSDAAASTSGDSAFQSCVIERESGGDSQITNSSGHYGLYQFSYSTWVAYGGAPSEFGDASVAEQNAVFATAMSEGGEDNWAPYDGC
jgi:LysM repeat protein